MDTNESGRGLELARTIAEKIGATAEHVYSVFVKQALVEGWQDMAVGLGAGSVATAILFNLRRVGAAFLGADVGANPLYWIAAGALVVADWYLFVNYLIPGVGRVVNPEYAVMNQVASTAKDLMGGK